MKTLFSSLLSLSLLLSFCLESQATAPTETPSPQSTQTLGQTYITQHIAVTDYLEVLRHLEGKTQVHLSTEDTPFQANQAATLRAQALNRCVYHEILSKIVSPSMTNSQKVRAIYNFPMYNFLRYDTNRESLPSAYLRTAYAKESVTVLDRGSWLLAVGTGGCQEYATLFNRLMNSAGFPCFNVTGDYVNSNGSSMWHAYNRAFVDGAWYWYDVDVEGSLYRRGDVSSPIYFLYQKATSYWRSNHAWDEASVWAKEQEIASLNYFSPGSIFSYETQLEVSFNGTEYSPSLPLYGYVDIDSDFFSESVLLLPFFDLCDFLGLNAHWDGNISRLVLEEGANRVEFSPGSYVCTVNGVAQSMAVPIQVLGGQDYLSADDLLLLLDFDLNMKFYPDDQGNVHTSVLFQGGKSTISYEKEA